MPVRVKLLKQSTNKTLERTTGEQDSSLEPSGVLKIVTNGSFGSHRNGNDQQQVLLCLIFIS